ncbi:MAG: hypothetical protein D6704_03485 [Nitrospirae bacterium]|nr:MAG: hypothetical protein D6704_03485 [Nitrospirota bacterium]
MFFDPAIAAQQALHRAEEQGELGPFHKEIVEAEEIFSCDESSEATQAFERLHHFGEQLPHARAFQEFLIYLTWQQVMAQPLPHHLQKGWDLCNRFLKRFGPQLEGSQALQQVLAMRESFRKGIGIHVESQETLISEEYDQEAFSSGD